MLLVASSIFQTFAFDTLCIPASNFTLLQRHNLDLFKMVDGNFLVFKTMRVKSLAQEAPSRSYRPSPDCSCTFTPPRGAERFPLIEFPLANWWAFTFPLRLMTCLFSLTKGWLTFGPGFKPLRKKREAVVLPSAKFAWVNLSNALLKSNTTMVVSSMLKITNRKNTQPNCCSRPLALNGLQSPSRMKSGVGSSSTDESWRARKTRVRTQSAIRVSDRTAVRPTKGGVSSTLLLLRLFRQFWDFVLRKLYYVFWGTQIGCFHSILRIGSPTCLLAPHWLSIVKGNDVPRSTLSFTMAPSLANPATEASQAALRALKEPHFSLQMAASFWHRTHSKLHSRKVSNGEKTPTRQEGDWLPFDLIVNSWRRIFSASQTLRPQLFQAHSFAMWEQWDETFASSSSWSYCAIL